TEAAEGTCGDRRTPGRSARRRNQEIRQRAFRSAAVHKRCGESECRFQETRRSFAQAESCGRSLDESERGIRNRDGGRLTLTSPMGEVSSELPLFVQRPRKRTELCQLVCKN